MTTRIRNITFDCRSPHELGRFWAAALGFGEHPDFPNEPDDTEVLIVDPNGRHPGLLFIEVPEDKVVKNRLHLDLQPDETRDAAVERLASFGASFVADHRRDDGSGWVVMADPEGNELCVERSAAERDDIRQPVDTGERPMPGGHHVSDERTMLTQMLDWYREGVVLKVQGVSQAHASATPLRSATSIAGVVKHLALVEESWFVVRFDGQPTPAWWADVDWDADRDWEFHSAVDEPIADVVARYETACARSREITAAHELDDIGADTSRLEFSLRYVLVHMIEETARHLGHLDILREQLDGTTGE